MISSSGNEKTCERTETGSDKMICVYNLLVRNLSSADAGTYYCALTSCGEIVFGNGTRLNIITTNLLDVSPTVIALMILNIILGMVTLLLAWKLYRNRRNNTTEKADGSSDDNQATDGVTYAAVCSVPKSSSSRPAMVKYSREAVVYSDVWYRQQQ
ncbi:hypothetical protein LDENG_00142410 [Lucifuga dentata]|nr:hypothetical protein LDENG_00142410 [Lucifuga dentata]